MINIINENEEKMKEQKPRMDRVRYKDGATSVCLILQDNQVVARGISICSDAEERFDPFIGSEIAYKRAMEALGRKQNCHEILVETPRLDWYDMFHLSLARDRFGDYKAYYMPRITRTEAMLLRQRKKR